VVLAEPRRRVAVLPQDRADGGTLLPDDGILPGVSSGHFGDHAEAHRVTVAARDQRRPGRRAESRESNWIPTMGKEPYLGRSLAEAADIR
jgi:hypothetical protein